MKKAQKQILILIIIACSTLQCSREYEVVISGGTIYDGSGEAPFSADIGISDGVIQAIGRINPGNSKVIHVFGLYISPGFIDMHTHCDRGLVKPGMSEDQNYLKQGVTMLLRKLRKRHIQGDGIL